MLARHRRSAALAAAIALTAASSSSRPAIDEPARKTHVVEPGQTAWSIAHAYRVQVEDLLQVNGIADPLQINTGQELTLPALPAPQSVSAPETPAVPDRPLIWPLKGHLSSLYGRRHRSLHSGLDIAASPGTIIIAAAAGKVLRAGKSWGRYGRVVLLEHPQGRITLYAHTQRCFVREGETVRQGQAIAAVGRTGNATGPHLHFEVWIGDRTHDPLSLLELPEDAAPTPASRTARR